VGPPARQRRHPVQLLTVLGQRARTLRGIVRNAHREPAIRGRPLVSVVLATYNWSSVLRHSIRSVLWQTYPNLELLVIGDGCTDDSEQVVASFGDERVRWHNLERNSGSQAIPNNVGLELASGEYIAYQGHDDVWHPAHLAALLAPLQSARGDFAYGLAEVLGPPGTRVRFLTGRVHPDDLRPGTWFPPASLLHTVELSSRIGGWQTWEEGGSPPDVGFVNHVIESGASLVRVPALTTFKFPSGFRPGAYRERPSHEQEAYIRRIAGECLFAERELAALALRRLSPLKPRLQREEPSGRELIDPMAQYAYLRRVRGLD
jgi:glycosyltransferase involved in cell wall biosynthesis